MAQHDLTPAKQLIQKCRETRDPYLDLGQCGITDLNDLPELFECSHLETLILSNRWRDYDKRTWINSSNTGPKNKLDFIPQEIAQLKNLAILIIGGEFAESWGISDIRSLGMLTSLQSLIISNNQIPDIRSLEKLTGLQALDLSSNQISDIQFLEMLTGLQSLSLSKNPILDYSFLEKLTGLQSLSLNKNQIHDYSFLEKLTGLQSLDLSNNQIFDYSFLEKLIGLQSLNLNNNQISDIQFLEKLTKLQSLFLSNNQISDIQFLEKLTGLQALILSNNRISNIRALEKLTGLQALDLRSNQISDIQFLEKLTGLQTLILNHNQISDIRSLKKLTALQSLILSNNQITDIHGLGKLTGLQSLDLSNNQISDYSFLAKLTGLQFLYLSNNQISDIQFLEKLTGLQFLYLSNNQISNVRFLEELVGLQALDLRSNQISDIRGLKKLTALQALHLGFNQISDIWVLEKLTGLQTSDFRSNQIQEIPESIFQLNMEINLEENGGGLNLYNNPIKSPPLEIIKQGRQAVLEWFAAKKVKLNEIKIILIGDPKAGKTSLLRRLKDDSFNQEEAQTDGVNIEDIQFGACQTFQAQTILHPITGHFWDFGGQEIMNATHQFFLTRRSVYILVLDARKDDHVAAQIRQWLKRVSATGGNSPVLVVANQIDINSGFGFENEYELQREFPQVKYFIKASCATGEKIGFIKEKLAELIPEAEFFQTTEIDERWMALKDALQQETKPKHFLNEDRFIELCRQCGLIKPSERRYAINFLHDLGIVLHFEAIKRYDYYVLDPFWITYGVYQILTSALAGANNGMVGMDQLEYIINEEPDKKERYRPTGEAKIEYTNQQSRFLLEILNQFKLCFRLPDDSRFIIPDLLDTDEPEELTGPIRNAVGSLRFVYDYDYLPKFIMPRIIVETHRVHAKIWRTGCVLKNNGCLALISNYQNRISIAVTGEDKKKWEFMSVIRFLIDSINRELSDPPNMLIPLPGTNEFADYEELLEREKDRETYYTLYKPVKRKFEISLLLQGVASRDEVRIISEKLDLLDRKFDTMLSKLDAHFDYLIELPANRDVKAEIAAAVAELKLQPSPDLVEDIIAGISAALDQSTAKMDRRLNEILADWQQTDQVGMKLKLAVPLLNLIGLQLETEFDVKKWAAQMVQKHKNKQIFHTILEARARSLGRDEIE